jgi:hypothetical protein
MPSHKKRKGRRTEFTIPVAHGIDVVSLLEKYISLCKSKARLDGAIETTWPELPPAARRKLAAGDYTITKDRAIVVVVP